MLSAPSVCRGTETSLEGAYRFVGKIRYESHSHSVEHGIPQQPFPKLLNEENIDSCKQHIQLDVLRSSKLQNQTPPHVEEKHPILSSSAFGPGTDTCIYPCVTPGPGVPLSHLSQATKQQTSHPNCSCLCSLSHSSHLDFNISHRGPLYFWHTVLGI